MYTRKHRQTQACSYLAKQTHARVNAPRKLEELAKRFDDDKRGKNTWIHVHTRREQSAEYSLLSGVCACTRRGVSKCRCGGKTSPARLQRSFASFRCFIAMTPPEAESRGWLAVGVENRTKLWNNTLRRRSSLSLPSRLPSCTRARAPVSSRFVHEEHDYRESTILAVGR